MAEFVYAKDSKSFEGFPRLGATPSSATRGDEMNKIQKSGYTLVELVIVFGGLATLALLGLGIYVLYHFISKYW